MVSLVIIVLKKGYKMDAIVVDSKSIYIVPIHEGANEDDVLAAYMKTSGEYYLNNRDESYNYCITLHSATLYSIRKAVTPNDRYLSFLMGEVDIADWWAKAYPIIEQIANTTGTITGIATIISTPFAFVKWIRSKNNSVKANEEYTWIQSILHNDSWNISVLSEKLSMPEDQVKNLLKGFGYIWDSHKMLYIATKYTKKLRNQKT